MVTGKVNKAVFLDRDGVLNQTEILEGKPYAPRSVDDFKIFDECPLEMKKLKDAGFLLAVVTNQPDVGNGKVDRQTVEAMHDLLWKALPLDHIEVCYHAQGKGCDCRKPRPGMILKAAGELGVDLGESFLVGDRKSDIQAGMSAGCATIFIDRGYRRSERPDNGCMPDFIVTSMAEAADKILSV